MPDENGWEDVPIDQDGWEDVPGPISIGKPLSVLKGAAEILPGAIYSANYYVGKLVGMKHDEASDWAKEQEELVARGEPQGLTARLLEKGTIIAGRMPFYLKAAKMARVLPFLTKHPVIAQSLGYGGVEAGKELLRGKPEEALKTGAVSTATYPIMHAFGKGGATATMPLKPLLRKVASPAVAGEIATRIGTAAGMAGIMAATTPKEERLEETLLGAGLGGLFPAEPFGAPPKNIISEYYKAVKPSTKGKLSFAKRQAYENDINTAVATIVQNKGSLSLPSGEGLPQNMVDFSKAIDNVKDIEYNAWKAMETKTGEVRLNYGSIVDTIRKEFVNNKQLPSVRKAADDLATYIWQAPRNLGSAVEIIKNLNEPMKTSYEQMNFEGKAKPYARALELLRNTVDSAIEKRVGPGWQESRNRYKSVRRVEEDVNKAVLRIAKKSEPKLYDSLMNTVGSSNIVAGIISANPGWIVKGLVVKGITHRIARMRDPNLKIRGIFRRAGGE